MLGGVAELALVLEHFPEKGNVVLVRLHARLTGQARCLLGSLADLGVLGQAFGLGQLTGG